MVFLLKIQLLLKAPAVPKALVVPPGRKLHILLCLIWAEICLDEATGSFTMSAD